MFYKVCPSLLLWVFIWNWRESPWTKRAVHVSQHRREFAENDNTAVSTTEKKSKDMNFSQRSTEAGAVCVVTLKSPWESFECPLVLCWSTLYMTSF